MYLMKTAVEISSYHLKNDLVVRRGFFYVIIQKMDSTKPFRFVLNPFFCLFKFVVSRTESIHLLRRTVRDRNLES